MATGERRLGSCRRGMTVLGKIPTPSVPKPINLPSQRLENKGLEPDVELVPRGTFSWGSSGRSIGGGVGKSRTPEKDSGAWSDAIKPQVLLASGKDGDSSLGSSRPSSAGSSTRPSSAPTTATNKAWASMLKTPVEAKAQSIGFMVNSAEPSQTGSKESADRRLQENRALLHRPSSADGVVSGSGNDSKSGATSYVRAGPGIGPGSGAVPEGLHHPGDGYNLPYMWQTMTCANGQPGPYSGPFPPPDVFYRPFGASTPGPAHFSNMKDRDMVMVRMANSPGLYGSYPPPLRPGQYFGRPVVYSPHFEQLVVSGNDNVGSSLAGMGMFFPDNGYPSSQREGNNMQKFSSGPIYENERNPRMAKFFGRHKSSNEEGFDHGKELSEGVTVVPERKITLLTKASQVTVSSTTPKGSSTKQVSDEGSDASLQAIHSLSSNNKMMEPSDSKSTDGNEVKSSSRVHFPAEILSGGPVVSTSPSNKVEPKTCSTTLSYIHKPPMTDTESEADVNSFHKSDANSHGSHSIKQACKGGSTSGSFEKSLIAEPTKQVTMAEDIHPIGDVKAKTKVQNLKSEKEWRPRSTTLEAKATNEREPCDIPFTSVLQAPTSAPTQKAGKHRADKPESGPNSKVRDLPERPSSAELATLVSSTINIDNRKKFSKEASSDGLSSDGVGVVPIDMSKGSAAEALPLRVDHKAKSRSSNLKAEKEWRPKSPAVDVSAASNSVMGSQITESNVTSASDVTCSHDRTIAEEESIQSLETYDYEGQRAKMKEIAAQRATQRQKEEEERVKEQKTKALAKLEELNRRTLVNSTSMELIEPVCELPVNEGPNKNLKRKPDSGRRSAMDASLPDLGISEKQPVDAVVSLSTGPVNKKPSKVGVDGLSDAYQTSRNMREESHKDNPRVTEKQRGYRKVATIVYDHHEEQEQVGMPKEPLPLVHDIDCEWSSTSKYGVHGKVREGTKHGQRHAALYHSNKASSTMEDEGKSASEEHQDLVASQGGNTRGRRGGSRKGTPFILPHQASIEGRAKEEGSVPGEHCINACEAKRSQRRKTSLAIEQVENDGKQSIEPISASEVGFGSDKPGRPHVSWRQKSSNENQEHLPAGDTQGQQNTRDKSPTQPQNPCKVRDDGRHVSGAPNDKPGPMETREQSKEHEFTELKRSNALCEPIPEAVSRKSEGFRVGSSHNGWRPKANQSFANESRSKTPEYAPGGMLDASQPSSPFVMKEYAYTASPRVPKSGPLRVPHTHGQGGSEAMMEDERTGHVRNRHRHKGDSVGVSQPRKQESRSHGDHTLPLNRNTQIFKQIVHITKTKEPKNVVQNENRNHARQLHSTSRREQVHEPTGQHPPRRGHERHFRTANLMAA